MVSTTIIFWFAKFRNRFMPPVMFSNVPFVGCNPPQRMVGKELFSSSICAVLGELFALQLYKLYLYVCHVHICYVEKSNIYTKIYHKFHVPIIYQLSDISYQKMVTTRTLPMFSWLPSPAVQDIHRY